MPSAYITKGSRIHATWFVANDPPSSLAGVMLKVGARMFDVTGVCRHFRADTPDATVPTAIFIDPDHGTWDGPLVRPPGCTCDHGHVKVDPKHCIPV